VPDVGLIDETVGVEPELYVNVDELGNVTPFETT
jgi:hypothetical protein